MRGQITEHETFQRKALTGLGDNVAPIRQRQAPDVGNTPARQFLFAHNLNAQRGADARSQSHHRLSPAEIF
jgi:hypothetical protein